MKSKIHHLIHLFFCVFIILLIACSEKAEKIDNSVSNASSTDTITDNLDEEGTNSTEQTDKVYILENTEFGEELSQELDDYKNNYNNSPFNNVYYETLKKELLPHEYDKISDFKSDLENKLEIDKNKFFYDVDNFFGNENGTKYKIKDKELFDKLQTLIQKNEVGLENDIFDSIEYAKETSSTETNDDINANKTKDAQELQLKEVESSKENTELEEVNKDSNNQITESGDPQGFFEKIMQPIIFVLVGLFILFLMLYFLLRNFKNDILNKVKQPSKSPDTSYFSETNKHDKTILNELKRITSSNSAIQEKIDQLENSIQQIQEKKNVNISSLTPVNPTAEIEPKKTNKLFYKNVGNNKITEQVNGNDKMALWVVEPNETNTSGVYYPAASGKRYLLGSVDTLLMKSCDIVNNRFDIDVPKDFEVIETGRVEKDGNGWRITQEAKLKLS